MYSIFIHITALHGRHCEVGQIRYGMHSTYTCVGRIAVTVLDLQHNEILARLCRHFALVAVVRKGIRGAGRKGALNGSRHRAARVKPARMQRYAAAVLLTVGALRGNGRAPFRVLPLVRLHGDPHAVRGTRGNVRSLVAVPVLAVQLQGITARGKSAGNGNRTARGVLIRIHAAVIQHGVAAENRGRHVGICIADGRKRPVVHGNAAACTDRSVCNGSPVRKAVAVLQSQLPFAAGGTYCRKPRGFPVICRRNEQHLGGIQVKARAVRRTI